MYCIIHITSHYWQQRRGGIMSQLVPKATTVVLVSELKLIGYNERCVSITFHLHHLIALIVR